MRDRKEKAPEGASVIPYAAVIQSAGTSVARGVGTTQKPSPFTGSIQPRV